MCAHLKNTMEYTRHSETIILNINYAEFTVTETSECAVFLFFLFFFFERCLGGGTAKLLVSSGPSEPPSPPPSASPQFNLTSFVVFAHNISYCLVLFGRTRVDPEQRDCREPKFFLFFSFLSSQRAARNRITAVLLWHRGSSEEKS